ncbi:MAG: metalloregulator ArsR/SmtB family transcription factor [Steroidobacteraceae bacterium]
MVNHHARLDRTFAALVDPTRRAILARLERKDSASISELAQPFAIKLPAVMKHLEVLEDAGLVTRAKSGRTVTLTSVSRVRRIRARPAIVFDAVTTGEGIANWWGPDAGSVLVSESDPLDGGRYRVRFRMLDGTEHESSGEFLEMVRPEHVVMTWRWKDGQEDPGESRVEISLRPIREGTELTFTHAQLHDEETRRSHQEGWTGALDKLEAHFAEGSVAG